MRFTTRDLLWLMVVVAIGAGWWVDASAKNAKIRLLEFIVDTSKLRSLPPEPSPMPANHMQGGAMPSRPGFYRTPTGVEVPNASHPTTTTPPAPK